MMDQSNQLDLIWIFNVIWRRKWMIIGLLALAVFVCGAVVLYLPATYEASATIMIEPSEDATTSEYTALMASERLALTYSQIIISQPVLERVIDELIVNLSPTQLRKMIIVQPIKDTHLLRITITNVSSMWAQRLANTIAQEFIDYIDTLAEESYNQSLSYMESSISDKQTDIDAILAEIRRQNNHQAEVDSELSNLELQLSENRANYQILQQNAQALELSITQFTHKIHMVEQAYIENPTDYPPYEAILVLFFDQEILTGYVEYAGQVSDLIEEIYGPMLVRESLLNLVISQIGLNESPDQLQERISVTAVRGTQFLELRVSDTDPTRAIQIANAIATLFIDQNQKALANPYQNRLQAIEEEMNALNAQMTIIQNEIQNTLMDKTNVESELDRLDNELNTAYLDRRELQNNYDQLVFEAERSANNVMISEPASQPIKQSQFGPQHIGLVLILAIALGIGVAFLQEHLDVKIRTQDDIASLFNQKPLGTIGHIEKGKDRLIFDANSSAYVSEDFRKLSAIIKPAIEGVPLSRLLITSPNPGEGKSLVAANLAIILAQTGSKVVLVDADLHRPQIDFLFNLKGQTGLSEVLSSNSKRLPLIETKLTKLKLLTSGESTDESSILLSSPALDRVLIALSNDADLVIIDSPPILTVADASFLSQRVDGVLLVLRSGCTNKKAAVEAMALLRMTKIPFVGVVLTDTENQQNPYYQHYKVYHENSARKKSEIQQGKNGG